ncbi:serine-rich adhesin for platelets [Biomphalaria glabrata]|nr:serine-rich adhesin for platelets-like [Biomphalaria glabrata]
MFIFQVYLLLWSFLHVTGQCPSGCSECLPGSTAVCGSVCPNKINLPTDITTYVQKGNGTCDTPGRPWALRTDNFINYTKLENISITYSNVAAIHPTQPPFRHLTNFRVLSLAHNMFRGFGKTLLGLTKLEEIDLSSNLMGALLNKSMETLTSLHTLNLDHNRLSQLNKETFHGLVSLRTLILSNNPLVSLDQDLFLPLTNIENIYLHNVNIQTIPSGLITHLTALRNLDLSNNSLSTLSDDSFDGTSLDDLDLSSNQLTSVPTAAMKRCNKQPTQLSLAHNQISSLSNSDIKDFTIETLDLSHNQISQIPRDLFQNVKITNIYLNGNPINKIEDNTFDGLQLSSLDLSNTRLVSLPSSTETWLKNTSAKVNLNNTNWQCDCDTFWLAELLTTHTNIVSPTCGVKYSGQLLSTATNQIRTDCITTTTQSTTTISHCPANCTQCDPGGTAVCSTICVSKANLPKDITTYIQTGSGTCNGVGKSWILRTENFINYTKLETISLTNSNVANFHPRDHPFEHLGNILKSLSLAHDRILTYGRNLENLTKLEELDLSYNNISGMLNNSLSNLRLLKTLIFEQNQIKHLYNETFTGLDSLQTLVLSHNPLESIDKVTFKLLTNVETIKLQDVQMNDIDPNWFAQHKTLRNIDLSHNFLKSIDERSFLMTFLEDLDLSYNNLTSVPTAAIKRCTKQPTRLSLAHNQIPNISNADIVDFTVETLDLSDNQINQIPKDLFQNVPIESINLSGNSIDKIEDGTFDGLQLLNLDLSNTRLESLPRSTEKSLANTSTKINLNNTSWQCDCDTLWLAELLTNHSNIVSPTCGANTKYSGLLLSIAASQLKNDCNRMCDPGGRAVCGSICPKDVALPANIVYLRVDNGTCDAWARQGTLRPEYFGTYNDLKVLNLTQAHVDRFQPVAMFTSMSNLIELYLSHNLIRSFSPTAWTGLSSLEHLDLSHNTIMGFVAQSFSKLINLKQLNLSNNKITMQIPDTGFAGLVQLKTLTLSNNPISNIGSNVFQPLVNVETIQMNNLTLTNISNGLLSNLKSLRTVDISDNTISSVANDFLTGTTLDSLDLSNNVLTSIPSDAFKTSATPAKVLNLAHNKITQISSTDLKGITANRLDLSGNPITTIAGDAFDGTSISYIDLSNTGLTSLPNSTEAWLKGSISTINLRNNNWQCDCETLWLAELLTIQSNIVSPMCGANNTHYSGQLLSRAVNQMRYDCTYIYIIYFMFFLLYSTDSTTESIAIPITTSQTFTENIACVCDTTASHNASFGTLPNSTATTTASTSETDTTTVTTKTTTAQNDTTTIFNVTTSTARTITTTIITITSDFTTIAPATSVSSSTTFIRGPNCPSP